MTGVLSLTGVTVTAMACLSFNVPSVTSTTTSYTLSAPASVGASQFGALTNVSTPVLELIANFAASAPPSME